MMLPKKTRRPRVLLCLSLFLTFACASVLVASGGETRPLMRNFIGINGHTVQFKPDLYRPVSGLVRDYHPVEWDLGGNSAELPVFPLAKNQVDWNQVYGSW